jgi:integrase
MWVTSTLVETGTRTSTQSNVRALQLFGGRLTDIAVKNARARDRAYKKSDGRGLCLLVQPNGAKWWRFRYRWAGKEQMLSLGTYPDTPLAEARTEREKARQDLAQDINPADARRSANAPERTLEAVARHWLAKLAKKVRLGKRSAKTLKKATWALETYVFPNLGAKHIGSIEPHQLLAILKKIEDLGLLETARRTRQRCGQVLRHGIGLGYCSRDITFDIRGLIEAPTVTHHAGLTEPIKVGGLLRDIDGYTGRRITVLAMQLSPLTFVRPMELRMAERGAFDLEAREWRVSRTLMKMKVEHVVPLSRQAIHIVREAMKLSVGSRYLFPCLGDPRRCMSENTINDALRRLGYDNDEQTGQGIRVWHPRC